MRPGVWVLREAFPGVHTCTVAGGAVSLGCDRLSTIDTTIDRDDAEVGVSTNAAHDDWMLPASALTSFLLWDAFRIWLPSILFIAGDAGSTSALTMGAVAMATTAAPVIISIAFGGRLVRLQWLVAIGLLIASRIALHFTAGGAPQFALSTLAVFAGAIAIATIASTARSGANARLAVLLGIVASSLVHATLGGIDLQWRHGATPVAATMLLGVALAFAARHAAFTMPAQDAESTGTSAMAWWMLGPIALLIGIQLAPPGRIAASTGWSDQIVTLTLAVILGLLIVAMDVSRRLPPRPTAALAAVAILIGTLGSLRAESTMSVLAQLALAVGLGGIAGIVPEHSETPARWRATGGAGMLLALVALGFAHYAPYDITAFYNPRTVLLVAAVTVSVAGVAATQATNAVTTRPDFDGGRTLTLVSVVVIAAIMGAGLTPQAKTDVSDHDRPDDHLRIAFINTRMGFNLAGELAITDLADELRDLAPDVVVLNEVDRGWFTTGSRDTLRILARELALDAVFAPAADDIWGNAILSSKPIAEFAVERLPQGRDAMTRSQLSVLLDSEQWGRIAVVGTHLSHVDDRGDTRVPQARAVAATVARNVARDIPTVVAGDLNAPLGSVEVGAFGEFVTSAFPEGMATWPSDDPQVQIDHILVSPAVTVLNATHFGHGTSDHVGLVVDLAHSTP
jgi:endonuclease/exonuclease/phosphatase family metal-dependent hydrolase